MGMEDPTLMSLTSEGLFSESTLVWPMSFLYGETKFIIGGVPRTEFAEGLLTLIMGCVASR